MHTHATTRAADEPLGADSALRVMRTYSIPRVAAFRVNGETRADRYACPHLRRRFVVPPGTVFYRGLVLGTARPFSPRSSTLRIGSPASSTSRVSTSNQLSRSSYSLVNSLSTFLILRGRGVAKIIN